MSASRRKRPEPKFYLHLLQYLIIGTFQRRWGGGGGGGKSPSPPLEDQGICTWEVSQHSNFLWLSRAQSAAAHPCPASMSFPSVNDASLQSLTGTGAFCLNKAPLYLVIGAVRVVSCVETPSAAQGQHDFPESTENPETDHESLPNDSPQSFGLVLHGLNLLQSM